MKPYVSYDEGMVKLYRDNPQMALDALNACMEDGDMEMLLVTLRHIAKGKGVAELAEATGLQKNTLYRTLSSRGNPNLRTLLSICVALGVAVRFEAQSVV